MNRPDDRGNSFSNGQSAAMGASVSMGPGANEWVQGWDIRPWTHWDHTEGRAYL